MPNPAETLRNALAARISAFLPAGQLRAVLAAFDAAAADFTISAKSTALAVPAGSPEALKWFLASKAVANCSGKTLQQYRWKLSRFLSAVPRPFPEITPNDIRLYLFRYRSERGVSDRTLEHTRIVIHSFFQWLVDNDYLQKNPAAKVERIRYLETPREPLSPRQLELLRWSCADVREKALIDFLFSTGCRVSECAAVSRSDVDWIRQSVRIRSGKGNKPRTVFFNAEAAISLAKYLEARTDADPALFVRSRAPFCGLSARSVELIVRKVSLRSGVPVYPHKLRHTFATAGLRGGIPLERLQALMGHAAPRTTLIYAKLDPSDLQRDHRRAFQ